MVNDAFRKIFWGLIFIFLEIHIIVVDLLPDPIGYLLIFLGLKQLMFDDSRKGTFFSMVLIFISIPTIFIQNVSPYKGNASVLSGWTTYMEIIGILNLVLAFYLFQVMISIAVKRGDILLQKRTSITSYVYIISMFVMTFLQSFIMNMSKGIFSGIVFFLSIFGFVLQIVFLILVSRYSRLTPLDPTID